MTLLFHALPCPLPGHAQNNYEKYDHKEITEFAIKIQLDEELCAELGAVPLSHDEILECQSLEEACWIPDEKWISDMCAAFKKASEMVLLTERTKSMAVAELPEPVQRTVKRVGSAKKAKAAGAKVKAKTPANA